jgi:hypothetical protein
MYHRITQLLIIIPCVLLNGCITKDQKTVSNNNSDKDEYVFVTVVGSNIPIKVRKSDLKAYNAEVEQPSQDALHRLQTGNITVPPPGVGK